VKRTEEEKWAYDGEDKTMKILWVIFCFVIMGLVGCGGDDDDDTISCACNEPGAFVDDRSSDDSSDSSSDDSSSSGCRRLKD